MDLAYTIVTVIAALWIGFSSYAVLSKAAWVVEPLASYGVPQRWWVWLGLAKGAGSLGLLAGLLVPPIGIAAATGLVLYFICAVITVLRARSYRTVQYPVLYLVPAAAALTLGLLA